MVSHKYLYGFEQIIPIPEECINSRIDALNKRLSAVMKVHYTKRNNDLKIALIEALNFWKRISHEEKL